MVSLRLENNRLAPNAMEPRVVDRRLRCGRRQLHALYQLAGAARGAHPCRAIMCSMCRRRKFRVIAPDVGGGFGVKADAYPGGRAGAVGLAPLRPAGEMDRDPRRHRCAGDNHGRDQVVHAELALDAARQDPRRARARAARRRRLHRVGRGRAADVFAALHAGRLRHPDAAGSPPRRCSPTPRRSASIAAPAGRKAIYVIERLLDRAAAELGIGPTRSAGAISSRRRRCRTRRRPARSTTAANSSG